MLHTAPPPPAPLHFPHADATDYEMGRAKAYIAAARACGLLIFPWFCPEPGVGLCGRETDGPNDFDSGLQRLVQHPDGMSDEKCRKGLVFRTLCDDYGLEPDDPQFCRKVNAALEAEAQKVAA